MKTENLVSEVVAESPNRPQPAKNTGNCNYRRGCGNCHRRQTPGPGIRSDPGRHPAIRSELGVTWKRNSTPLPRWGQTIDQVGIGIDGSGTPGRGPRAETRSTSPTTWYLPARLLCNLDRMSGTTLRYSGGALSAAGVQPVAKPAINLGALGIGFANILQFLTLARVFEDIGVTAYGGAAGVPSFASSPYIGTAARILAVEAEHAANIRLQIARLNIPTTALDGVDVLPPPSGTEFFSDTDTTSLTQIRTPGQVLYLAYGNRANATSGGFFPAGFNGALNMSSASA